jgi:phosphoglycolate phosphatase-like HAD superfamily hydrolase
VLYNNYQLIRINNENIYVNKNKINELNYIDNIIFDCDGVLIDTRNSYDITVKKTVEYIFKSISNKNIVTDKEIHELRFTGLFNNDWDLTYTIGLGIFAHLTKDLAKTVINDLKQEKQSHKLNGSEQINNFHEHFKELVNAIRDDPIDSIKKYALSLCKSNNTLNELNEFMIILGDPMDPKNSMLVKLFDSIYYGKDLYKIIYNSPPLIDTYGLIKHEIILVDSNDLETLQLMIKNKQFLLLTGRSKISIEYVLASLLKYFNLTSSIFIEDLIRIDRNIAKLMKKPASSSLIKMSKGTTLTLYVGDSTEDILMVNNARQENPKILFAGITGTKENQNIIEEFFIRLNADIIAQSVRGLIKALHVIMGGYHENRIK